MTTGFSLFPFQTGTLSRRSRDLAHVQPKARLLLNTADAQRLGLGMSRSCGSRWPGRMRRRTGIRAAGQRLRRPARRGDHAGGRQTPAGHRLSAHDAGTGGPQPAGAPEPDRQANGHDGADKAMRDHDRARTAPGDEQRPDRAGPGGRDRAGRR